MQQGLIFTFLLMVFTAFPAQALLELRGHFGLQQTSADFNSVLNSSIAAVAPDIPGMTTYGADVVVNLPLMPIGFGLRYENLGFSASSGGVEFDVSSSTTSILINKRFIDLFAYFGVLATYGISNTASASINVTQTIDSIPPENIDIMRGTPTVYQVGVEGGVKLIGWILGGELGYASHKFSDVDVSGTYLKVIAGFGF